MRVRTIGYQRVLNLGNYESKRLELSAELDGGENVEEAISVLAEQVERKIREHAQSKVEAEIEQLNKQLRQMKKELQEIEGKILANSSDLEEPSVDSLPFDSGDTPVNSGDVPDGF